MVIYFEPKYYKVLHYYFFFLAIFSFVNLVYSLFFFQNLYSIILSFLSTIISLFMSWGIFYSEMKEFMIVEFSKALLVYVFLSIIGFSSAFTFWYFLTPYAFILSFIILTLNFFVIFFTLSLFFLRK